MTVKARALALLAALLFVALAHAHAVAQPSQASLVEAWEGVQRDDPETVVFEKLGERRYRFKTERFPFDGELRILKASVDGSLAEDELRLIMGVIEFELVGLSDEVVKKYQHSYSVWTRTNRLYFDNETGRWLTSEEHVAKITAEAKAASQEWQQTPEAGGQPAGCRQKASQWLSLSLTLLPILFLACFLLWLMKQTGIRRQREYMNRAARHMDNVEDLLERIAAAVEAEAKAKGRARSDAPGDADRAE